METVNEVLANVFRRYYLVDFHKLGDRIKEARLQKGWTQAQLGDMVFSDGKYVSRIERGKSQPSLSMVVDLANALEKSPNYLLQDSADYILPSDNGDIRIFYQKYGRDKTQHMLSMLEIIYKYMRDEAKF